MYYEWAPLLHPPRISFEESDCKNQTRNIFADPSGVSVNLGNNLTPTSVKDEPYVEWSADPNNLHALMMIDPDAPSRTNPLARSFKHWLVINIPGSDVAEGDIITQYVGAGPPKRTGLHRYVFLVYKQADEITNHLPFVSRR